MRRRRVLRMAAIGTGLFAGCVSDGPGAGSEPATSEETATETPDPRARTKSADTPTRTASDEATTWTASGEPTTWDPSADPTTVTNDAASRRTTEPTPTRTERTDGTAVPEGEIQRRVSLADVDEIPDEHELTIDVELLESTVTASHTARLGVRTTNRGSKRPVSVGTNEGDSSCAIFNRDKGKSDPPGLWLHEPASAEHIERDGNRWSRDRGPNDPPIGVGAYGCPRPAYTTDESIITEYLVWDDYLAEGYMTPGTYRFARSITVGGQLPTSTIMTTTEPEATFTWGFDLAIENPE